MTTTQQNSVHILCDMRYAMSACVNLTDWLIRVVLISPFPPPHQKANANASSNDTIEGDNYLGLTTTFPVVVSPMTIKTTA